MALSANEDLSEALAINEERKHCKNDNRLRELCVRVLAVDTALNGEKCGLPAVYNVFRSSGMPENESFRSALRVKRGLPRTGMRGAFVKDHCYFSGIKKLDQYLSKGGNLKFLYTCKMGFDDLPLVESLLGKGAFKEPKYFPV